MTLFTTPVELFIGQPGLGPRLSVWVWGTALFITPTQAQEAARCLPASASPSAPMAQETFAFTSSALRSLRLQQELLEQEDRRRALAREWATRRFLGESPRPPLNPPRRPQICRDPAVHNALYTGDLLRIKSIFKDETTANMVMETVSEELVWSPEQGTVPGGGASLGGSFPFPAGCAAELTG